MQARIEGWITGLHLAALSLLNHDDPAGFITAFSGSHRYVVEYLLEEVLSRQSEAIQDFLLQTSLLDRAVRLVVHGRKPVADAAWLAACPPPRPWFWLIPRWVFCMLWR